MKPRHGIVVLAFAIAVNSGAGSVLGAIPGSERDALAALFNATNGPGWNDNTNWLDPPGTECTWAGVGCDPGEEHVVGLFLGSQNMVGSIPGAIADLTALEILGLDHNPGLEGTIPIEIGSLPILVHLDLADCSLTGDIPVEIANLSNLTFLNLSGNFLAGQIPVGLGGLTGLNQLFLDRNRLEGSIPVEIGNLVNLFDLNLWGNDLVGSIPPELGNLSQLISLSLDYNHLTGSIPPELTNLTALHWLNLAGNELTGSIPMGFGGFPNLMWFGMNDNQFAGPIPSDLGTLPNLRELHLEGNNLTGEIPPELGGIATLEFLLLGGNNLEGPIPPELAGANALIGLALDNNHLTGPIPSQLGSLTNLVDLNLSGNRLSGSIPPQIGNLTQLSNLNLSGNCLEGALPPELGNLGGLQHLHLSSNMIVGTIPSQITLLTNLMDGENGIDFNGFQTADPGVGAFVDAKFGMGWRDTQTVPPDNLVVDWVTGISAGISWNTIPYQWDRGGYEILIADNPGGPYEPDHRTLGKQRYRWPIFDLSPSTTYWIKLCTITEPHFSNQNTVVSEMTDWIEVSTAADSSTWYASTTGLPANDCATPATPCPTIQEAVLKAVPGERVLVAPGIYNEQLSLGETIQIQGDGPATTVIDGGGSGPVVWVGWGDHARLSGLTIRNGVIHFGGGIYVAPWAAIDFSNGLIEGNHANALGGGIFLNHDAAARLDQIDIYANTAGENGGGAFASEGTYVSITDGAVSGNQAQWGGGLYFGGISIVERMAVDGNSALSYGGGGIVNEGTMLLASSAVTNNTAAHGGGVANQVGAQLETVNSTVSGNTGGGIFNNQWAHMGIESCTITDNTAPYTRHSGLMNWSELFLHNTVVAGNLPFNCANPVSSLGHNLDDDGTCGLVAAGDLSNIDPMLGPLADNGGPTLTHALPPNSPAIDAGDLLNFPLVDQRGWGRPVDGSFDGMGIADLGAVEYAGVIFFDDFESGDISNWSESMP